MQELLCIFCKNSIIIVSMSLPDIKISDERIDYPKALSFMEERVDGIIQGREKELLWLLEHDPVYTAGTSTNPQDMLNPQFPVYETGRGGQYTYHGPGQRIGYVMLDLAKRDQKDLRQFVWNLEEWVIESLKEFGVKSERRVGRVGLWVNNAQYKPNALVPESKIAAIGVRVRKWVTFHGVSINLDPDLTHFNGIVPCGIREFGVTSLHDLGYLVSMPELDAALQHHFKKVFK